MSLHRRIQAGARAPHGRCASTPSCRPRSSLSPVCLPREDAIAQIKHYIQKTYGKRGEAVVHANHAMVDASLSQLHEVTVPAGATQARDARPAAPLAVPTATADFVARLLAGEGDCAAGECVSGRRDLCHRHDAHREAQHRAGSAGVGAGPVHPVRQVRDGVSAFGDPRQGGGRQRDDGAAPERLPFRGRALARARPA